MRTSLCRGGQYLLSTLAVLIMLAPESARSQVPLAPNTQVPLSPKAIKKFVQPLPLLDVQGGPIATTAATNLAVTMCEFPTNILPLGTIAPGVQTSTWTWGYSIAGACPTAPQQTYIGPVVIARRNVPTEITWINNLGTAATTNVLAYKFSTDPTLHWADPYGLDCMTQTAATMGIPAYNTPCSWNYDGPIPAVPHLHGGEVPPEIDGGARLLVHERRPHPGARVLHEGRRRAAGQRGDLPLPEHAGGRAALVPRPHARRHAPQRLRWARRAPTCIADPDLALPPNLPGVGGGRAARHPGPDVRHQRPALLPGGHARAASRRAQPRAPLLGPGVRRRHHRRQRQGLAVPRRRAEALPLPLPERLQRPHLRAVPREPGDRHAWPRPVRDRHRRRLPRRAAGGRSGARAASS